MVVCRCNFLLRSVSPRFVFSSSFQMDSHSLSPWRCLSSSRFLVGVPAISRSPAACVPYSNLSTVKLSGHIGVSTVRGNLNSIHHHQAWDPRTDGHRQGARLMGSLSVVRWFRKMRLLRRRSALNKSTAEKEKEGELELDVKIRIEGNLPVNEELLNITEILRLNIPMAMKIAFDGIKDSNAKTRDTTIDDIGSFEKVELSVLLCDDDFIRKLNKEWHNKDEGTDVLSMPRYIPGFQLPILMLGDIVISVDAAEKQAEKTDHSLLDEIRILMVHGLLHLLGYENEKSKEAQIEMQNEKDIILKCLGWKGEGIMHSTREIREDLSLPNDFRKENSYRGERQFDACADQALKTDEKKEILRPYKPKFKYLFCDMDGTLLNSKSVISPRTAEALREANSRGVKIIIATGKTRPAVITALQLVDLAGENGIVSKYSPGVFLQGLLVYGKQGVELYRRNLDPGICKEAFLYSLEHHVPLVGFSEDRIVTLFDHPLIDDLHTVYMEPKAEVMPSLEHLLSSVNIQKLLFVDTAENVHNILRPHWSLATEGQARVVQALPEMMEILPSGASKGVGVCMLLDHLGGNTDEVMAIGDGENDVEMLDLVRWGVVMANGSDKAKAVANATVSSNDDDGVAEAIYRYIF